MPRDERPRSSRTSAGTEQRRRGRRPSRRGKGCPPPKVTVGTYHQDPLYPRIVRAVAEILEHGKVVAPVDVLVGIGLLRKEDLLDWRRGRVPYLERVVKAT